MKGDPESRPAILIADDGELEDLRSALRGLGFEVAHPDEASADRAALRISSLRRALARDPGDAARERYHVVVVERPSAVVRRELGRVLPDFVLARPFDATVLRLLVQHALYAGPERRRRPRVPLRASVRCRVGRTARPAKLVEISEGGCRLETRRAFDRGERLVVLLPAELGGGEPLELDARVVRTASGGARGAGSVLSSVSFLCRDGAVRARLRSLVASAAANAGAMRPRSPEPVRAAAPPERAIRPATSPRSAAPARRRSPRGSYRRPVLASGAGTTHVLVGRDLSTGGMRVDRDALIAVGQPLKLVIHGSAGLLPAVVKATVIRDEGPDGCVLRFGELPSTVRERLEAIVRELPGVHPADGEARGPNVVVSELVGLGG